MKFFFIFFCFCSVSFATERKLSLIRVNSFSEEGYELNQIGKKCVLKKKIGAVASSGIEINTKICKELIKKVRLTTQAFPVKKRCRINMVISSQFQNIKSGVVCLDKNDNLKRYSQLVFDIEKARAGVY